MELIAYDSKIACLECHGNPLSFFFLVLSTGRLSRRPKLWDMIRFRVRVRAIAAKGSVSIRVN